MKKYTRAAKGIIATGMLAAVLACAQPAEARWDEALSHSATYALPTAREAIPQENPGGTYRVRRGDTLSGIAYRFGVSVSRLVSKNNLTARDRIYTGQVLRLPVEVVVHRVARGETVSRIASRYNVDIDTVVRYNNLHSANMVRAGSYVRIPVSGDAGFRAGRPGVLPVRELSWPVNGWISSPFGMRDGKMHEGVDFGAGSGDPIRAVREGRVVIASYQGTYGLTVVIDHGDGLSTLYSHCSGLHVRPGEWVNEGEIIARVGSTGRSTGPHLHLEVRLDGIPFDPLLCLKGGYHN